MDIAFIILVVFIQLVFFIFGLFAGAFLAEKSFSNKIGISFYEFINFTENINDTDKKQLSSMIGKYNIE